jgi:hypothetical protein
MPFFLEPDQLIRMLTPTPQTNAAMFWPEPIDLHGRIQDQS